MPKYLGKRDLNLFIKINKQLINTVINTKISVYKINAYQTKSNLYGQALKRIYYPDIIASGIIQHNSPDFEYTEFGINVVQQIQIKFLRQELKQKNLYVEIGDIIE